MIAPSWKTWTHQGVFQLLYFNLSVKTIRHLQARKVSNYLSITFLQAFSHLLFHCPKLRVQSLEVVPVVSFSIHSSLYILESYLTKPWPKKKNKTKKKEKCFTSCTVNGPLNFHVPNGFSLPNFPQINHTTKKRNMSWTTVQCFREETLHALTSWVCWSWRVLKIFP